MVTKTEPGREPMNLEVIDRESVTEVRSLEEWAEELVIDSPQMVTAASIKIGKIAEHRKRIVDWFSQPKRNAHRSWKGLVAKEKEVLARFDEPDRILRGKILAFQHEEEKAREAARSAETIKVDLGGGESVEIAPTPPQAAETPGLATRTLLRAEVTDLPALCAAIGRGEISANLVTPNASKLNSLAVAFGLGAKIPGVRIFEEKRITRIGSHAPAPSSWGSTGDEIFGGEER